MSSTIFDNSKLLYLLRINREKYYLSTDEVSRLEDAIINTPDNVWFIPEDDRQDGFKFAIEFSKLYDLGLVAKMELPSVGGMITYYKYSHDLDYSLKHRISHEEVEMLTDSGDITEVLDSNQTPHPVVYTNICYRLGL
jgi:hypothetical protein